MRMSSVAVVCLVIGVYVALLLAPALLNKAMHLSSMEFLTAFGPLGIGTALLGGVTAGCITTKEGEKVQTAVCLSLSMVILAGYTATAYGVPLFVRAVGITFR